MKSFKNLIAWEKSHMLVLEIYKITKNFPSDEKFGLTQQIRRSSVSIAANIAEGSKRRSDKDFSHFLNMSEGSLEELKYYLILSKDLHYIDENHYEHLYAISEEVGRLIQGFIKKLRA